MIQISYCEYNRYNVDYDRIYRPTGGGTYLLLLFLSPMKVFLNQGYYITNSGACLLYTPDYKQDYRAVKEFKNSYVHFQIDSVQIEQLHIPQNEIFYPQNPELLNFLFKNLQEEFLTKQPNSNIMMDAILKQILVLLSRESTSITKDEDSESSIYYIFQQLRLKILSTCEENWDIPTMCNIVHLEKTQFYHYYETFFCISPKADLLNARLERAKLLLTNEALQIKQVSELCGFTNPSHFSRQFRKKYGISPRHHKS